MSSADLTIYLWICLGVIVAVVWPMLKASLRKFTLVGGVGVPAWLKPYLILLAFAVITGLVIFAYWRSQHPNDTLAWYAAFLLGFAWEATFEKITTTPKTPPTAP
jgi:hypothetical protein